MKYHTFFVWLWAVGASAWAALIFAPLHRAYADGDDPIPGSRYTSARAAAMGGAYLPLGDDGASGLFYNPADLARIRGSYMEPLNLTGDIDTGYTGTAGLNNFYDLPSGTSYGTSLENHVGTNAGGGFQLLPNFFTRGFAFGVLMSSQVMAEATSSGIRYRTQNYLIPTAGTAVSLADGIVRIGYSIQWVNEAVGDVTVASPQGYNVGIPQGSALSNNIGFALTLPYAWLPALNLVARNAFGTHYGSSSLFPLASDPSGTPANEPSTFDGSLSIQPRFSGGSYLNVVAEFRDMTDQSGITYLGRIAAGVEYSYRDQFFLRGGWGEGYPSGGIGVKRRYGEFSLTYYTEEIGGGYHVQGDTRVLFQYQIRIY